MADIIELYGFGDPVVEQFKRHLVGISQWELGFRAIFGENVPTLIKLRQSSIRNNYYNFSI